MSRAVVQCVCVWIVVEVLCACGGNLESVIQSTDGDNTGCALVLISFNEIMTKNVTFLSMTKMRR